MSSFVLPNFRALLVVLTCCLMPNLSMAENADASQPWETLQSSNNSTVTPRHEAAAVAVGTDLFVFGGRGSRPVERYDSITKTWHELGTPDTEFHHFQPVLWQDLVYLTSGFYCCYPNEELFTRVKLYNPATDAWSEGDEIPAARRRGGAASVVYQNKIYNIGGNTQGHNGGAVAWFDRYDPATGNWEILPDAPNARDHFAAVVVNGKLIAAGGRQTTQPNPFLNTIAAVDIYDFASGEWSTAPNPLPTPRAGTVVAAFGTELIVIGGEVGDSTSALSVVEAFNVNTGQWRNLQSLGLGRHGAGGDVIGTAIHIAAGGKNRGGGTETNSHEMLLLDPADPPPIDSDVDGLTDDQELNQYSTDPNNPDSDGDRLDDGDEVDRDTDPNDQDTDDDLLGDGDEVLTHGTDPLRADSDNDTLTDGAELLQHGSDPKRADTDGDNLDDADEVTRGLDPANADTDADQLSDGQEINVTKTDPLKADTDGDGAGDGVEQTAGTDPLLTDSDSDGLSDGDEIITHGTNPLLADSDADQLGDAEEIAANFDPLDPDTDDDGVGDFEQYNASIAASNKKSSGGSFGWQPLLLIPALWLRRRRRV